MEKSIAVQTKTEYLITLYNVMSHTRSTPYKHYINYHELTRIFKNGILLLQDFHRVSVKYMGEIVSFLENI